MDHLWVSLVATWPSLAGGVHVNNASQAVCNVLALEVEELTCDHVLIVKLGHYFSVRISLAEPPKPSLSIQSWSSRRQKSSLSLHLCGLPLPTSRCIHRSSHVMNPCAFEESPRDGQPVLHCALEFLKRISIGAVGTFCASTFKIYACC